MAVQVNYGQTPPKAVPGGLYDLSDYRIDSRTSEADDGMLKTGFAAAQGTTPGVTVTSVGEETDESLFEGVIVAQGSLERQFITNTAPIFSGTTLSVLRSGRIWVQIPEEETPVYHEAVKLITSGEDAGKFSADGDVALNARFLGVSGDGIAAAEFFDGLISQAPAPEPPSGGDAGTVG